MSGGFHTTRWTLVRDAAGKSPAGQAALSELCATYYAPVLAFLTREERDLDAAQDLAHAFFAQVLQENALTGSEPARGRFRNYLLGAVKHFVANQRRAARREKRGGGVEHVRIGVTTEIPVGVDVVDPAGMVADALFDREWAMTVVETGLATLEAEHEKAGRRNQFVALKPWLTAGSLTRSQAEVAEELGLSEGALKVAIYRLRRRFRELVRGEVAQTLYEPGDLDDEMRYLVESLR